MLRGGAALIRHRRPWVLKGVRITNSPMRVDLRTMETYEDSGCEATQKENGALGWNDRWVQ